MCSFTHFSAKSLSILINFDELFVVCSTVQILVGVFVSVLVIVGILVLVIYLRKRSDSPQTRDGQASSVPTMRGTDDRSYPPTYEDIELRFSAFSNTEYAEVADTKGEQREDKMYENFKPTSQENQNQYEALQLPAGQDATDDGHVYAEAPPKY